MALPKESKELFSYCHVVSKDKSPKELPESLIYKLDLSGLQ